MTTPKRFGQTRFVEIRILPDLEIDFLEGQPVPEGLGKTEAPVRILPDLEIDFDDAEPTPTLQLTLSLREGENPAVGQLAVGLVKLYAAVNELELGEGGAGLRLDDASCEVSGADGKFRLWLRPTDPNGAGERLRHLVEQINQTTELIPAPFERCEARVAA